MSTEPFELPHHQEDDSGGGDADKCRSSDEQVKVSNAASSRMNQAGGYLAGSFRRGGLRDIARMPPGELFDVADGACLGSLQDLAYELRLLGKPIQGRIDKLLSDAGEFWPCVRQLLLAHPGQHLVDYPIGGYLRLLALGP